MNFFYPYHSKIFEEFPFQKAFTRNVYGEKA
jgi:hypothetical protein